MEHLNKLCALAHIQEILDIVASVVLNKDDKDVVIDELMRECADLSLVTGSHGTGMCNLGIKHLKYGLTHVTSKICRARQEYLVGNDEIPEWLAKIERDKVIEDYIKIAGIIADSFAKARAEESGIKYAALLNERSAKFKSIDLDYYTEPNVCQVYDDSCPFGIEHEKCPHAKKDGNGNLVCERLS